MVPVFQGGDQRILVDGGAARDIDDMAGGAECLQHFGIDHVAIGFVGAVGEDECVRPSGEVEDGLEVWIRDVLPAAVVIADFGLEGGKPVGDLEADGAEADNADLPPRDAPREERAGAGFSPRHLPSRARRSPVTTRRMEARSEGDGEVRDGRGIGADGVRHLNAMGSGGVDVDPFMAPEPKQQRTFRSGMLSNQALSAFIVPTVTTASTPFFASGSATMV